MECLTCLNMNHNNHRKSPSLKKWFTSIATSLEKHFQRCRDDGSLDSCSQCPTDLPTPCSPSLLPPSVNELNHLGVTMHMLYHCNPVKPCLPNPSPQYKLLAGNANHGPIHRSQTLCSAKSTTSQSSSKKSSSFPCPADCFFAPRFRRVVKMTC